MKTITREESQMVLRNYLKRKKTRSGTIQMSVDMMNNLDDNISSNREGIIMFAQACSWASFATIKLSSSSLSLQQFFNWMFLAFEGYCNDGELVVGKLMRIFHVCRYGISPQELSEIAGISRMDTLRFLELIRPATAEMSGKCFIISRSLMDAISRNYCNDHSLISGARHSMISFLSDPGKGHPVKRYAAELPWQLFKVGNIVSLRELLLDMNVFSYLWSHPAGVCEMLRYWKSCELLKSDFNMIEGLVLSLREHVSRDAKRKVSVNSERESDDAKRFAANLEQKASVARFLHLIEATSEAEALYTETVGNSIEIYGKSHRRSVTAIRELASVLFDQAKLEEAFSQIETSISHCKDMAYDKLIVKLPISHQDLEQQQLGPAPNWSPAHHLPPDKLEIPIPSSQLNVWAEEAIGRRMEKKVVTWEGDLLRVQLEGSETEDMSACLELKGRICRERGRYEEAMQCFETAALLNELHLQKRLCTERMSLNDGSFALSISLSKFAQCLHKLNSKRTGEIETIFLVSQRIMEICKGPDHHQLAENVFLPKAEYVGEGLGRWDEAFDILQRCVKIFSKQLGKDHELAREALNRREKCRAMMNDRRKF